MGDVIDFNGECDAVPVSKVCDAARNMKYVVIVGMDENERWVFRSSEGDTGKALLAMELGKRAILDG